MKKYKVLIASTFDGVEHAVDGVVELSDEVGTQAVSEGRLELIAEAAAEEAAAEGEEKAPEGEGNVASADADTTGSSASADNGENAVDAE